MKWTDAELREDFQEATRPPGSRADCIAHELLVEAAAGDADRSTRREIAAHLGKCSSCAQEYRLMRATRAFAEEASPPRPRALTIRVPLWRRPVVWAAAAAAAVAVLILPVALRDPGGPRAPVLREEEAAVPRSLVANAEGLPRDRFVLRWSAAPLGSRYSVVVSARDLTPLYEQSGLTKAEVVVPAADLASVRPGDEIIWMVTTLLPDGRRLSSPAFSVRLR
jgi:hypothetical protein